MDTLLIEIVIRKDDIKEIPDDVRDIIQKFKQQEMPDKIILNVPSDWDGLRDGKIRDIFAALENKVYVALAYITADATEVVTDFDGNPITRLETVMNDKMLYKYVKKRIRIVKMMDPDKNIFRAKGYILDLKFANPVVKVLEIYSVGSESNVEPDMFIRR